MFIYTKNRIKRNLSDDSYTGFDKDMANQISFIMKRPLTSTSRMNPNQWDDWNTGSDRDMDIISLFIPKGSSNPNSRMK